MKTLFKTLPLLAVLPLTACVSTPSNSGTLISNGSSYPQVRITDESMASLPGQITNALGGAFKQLNTRTEVNNIVGMTTERKTVNGQALVYMTFRTAEGKYFTGYTPANQVTDAQLQKLAQLKGATFVGLVPVKDMPNHYGFRNIENYRF